MQCDRRIVSRMRVDAAVQMHTVRTLNKGHRRQVAQAEAGTAVQFAVGCAGQRKAQEGDPAHQLGVILKAQGDSALFDQVGELAGRLDRLFEIIQAAMKQLIDNIGGQVVIGQAILGQHKRPSGSCNFHV